MRKGIYFTAGLMAAYFIAGLPFLVAGLRLPGIWRLMIGFYFICVFLGLCGCVAALLDRFDGLRAFALIPLWVCTGFVQTDDFIIQFPSALKVTVGYGFGFARLGVDLFALGIFLAIIILTWGVMRRAARRTDTGGAAPAGASAGQEAAAPSSADE